MTLYCMHIKYIERKYGQFSFFVITKENAFHIKSLKNYKFKYILSTPI